MAANVDEDQEVTVMNGIALRPFGGVCRQGLIGW
jgi:hypothetical protein